MYVYRMYRGKCMLKLVRLKNPTQKAPSDTNFVLTKAPAHGGASFFSSCMFSHSFKKR